MAKDFLTLDDMELRGKRVLLRLDINSPINPLTGRILDDTRIKMHLPTVEALREAKVAILAHQSRPGKDDFSTLMRHAQRMSQLIGRDVTYVDGLVDSHTKKAIQEMRDGDILMLENTRFYSEETGIKDDRAEAMEKTHIVNQLAPLFDIFVNDAFAAAHRAQPTLTGFTRRLPCVAGKLMEQELTMLSKALDNPARPAIAVLGGAKVDDSIDVMEHFLKSGAMDRILTGGVVAEICLLAKGCDLGAPSMAFIDKEVDKWPKLVEKAKELMATHGDRIAVPTDLAANVGGQRRGAFVSALPFEGPIMDIGLDTFIAYSNEIRDAGTVVLNGPMGVFEMPDFAHGTLEVFKAMGESKGFTVVGGGHSAAVAAQLGIEKKVDHISTGGGALISFLSGKRMPGIESLKESKRIHSGGVA